MDEPNGRRGPWIALVLIVALVLGGWWLSNRLSASSRLQDCVMSGRRDCAPIR